MGLFGDIGRIAREVKNISDEFATIKNDVVEQTKGLSQQARDVESVVKNGVKDIAGTAKDTALKKSSVKKVK